MAMRYLLGVLALLAAVLLGSCGEETTGAEQADEPDREPTGQVEFELVGIVTETAVGGDVAPAATPLPDVSSVQRFAAQFTDDRMQARLTQVVDGLEVPEDQAMYAAVVAIGCHTPSDITVDRGDIGLTISDASPIIEPGECLAPMTSVAVVLVDEALLG